METAPIITEKPGTGVVSDTRLNATELEALWSTYTEYGLMICFYKHFLSNVEDNDIRSVVEFALDIAMKRVNWVMETFKNEGIPIPIGYTDENINIEAPRLYSDPFYLYFLKNKVKISLGINSMALTTAARHDVREFYEHNCSSTAQLYQRTTDLLLAKGLYIRPPYITIAEAPDLVKHCQRI